jgi:hypothetical protein
MHGVALGDGDALDGRWGVSRLIFFSLALRRRRTWRNGQAWNGMLRFLSNLVDSVLELRG